MENAADALRMAAGVLIALLLISLFIMVFTRIGGLENDREHQKLERETNEFNAKFTSYDKPLMYGTDVVSCLGSAISNNKIANSSFRAHPDGTYNPDVAESINIEFRLNRDIIQKVEIYKSNPRLAGEWEWESTTETTMLSAGGKVYTLELKPDLLQRDREEYEKIENIAVNPGNFISDRIINGNRREKTDQSGFEDFKSRIFRCTQVQYNSVGRVCLLHFEEIETN